MKFFKNTDDHLAKPLRCSARLLSTALISSPTTARSSISRFWRTNARGTELKITVRKLTYLAADHKIINPFSHRAVFDVMTMLMVLSEYDPGEVLRYSASPSITIQAKVSYEDRAKASSRGYRWEAETKRWVKTIKQFQLDKEQREAMFNVIVLSERTA